MKYYIPIYTLVLLLFSANLRAQILSIVPENPTLSSTITLVYDASQGNGELAGYTGDIYMHTGVITAESTHPGDWKYVVTDWCENAAKTKLSPLGNNLYEATFQISSFYGIPLDEVAFQLAFVFRSADCNKVGRDANNKDIYYNLEFESNTTDYKSHVLLHDTLLVHCTDGEILLTPFSANIINVFSRTSGMKNIPSYSTIAEKQEVLIDFSQEQNLLKFSTDSLEVIIDTTDLNFKFVYQNDTILRFPKIYAFGEQGVLLSELKENERIYGSGSRAIEMDRKGRNLSINNQAHWGYGIGAESLNITLPVVNSSENYMLFFDNHSISALGIGSIKKDQMSYTFSSGQAEVYIIAGKNYGELVDHYSYLTGYQPMPPLWSLGYIQSKYGYETQADAVNIVNQLIASGYPLDALVLDLYWFGNTNLMGNLDWDYSRFPDPGGMMTDFKNQGVKSILITEPYFTLNSSNYAYADNLGYFAKDSDGDTYILTDFWAGDAALLDLFNPEVSDWFNQFYNDRTKEGVAGWWTDLGEPENHPGDMYHFAGQKSSEVHNIYSLMWNKMLYENWELEFPNDRLFNLSRSGFAGMQRYSTFPWSGDVQRSFDGLSVQVPIMLSLGLNGIPYMHSDVGGFAGDSKDDELFIRWVQMGVFAPIFRIHGSGIETAPTSYGINAQNISRNYIKWRYELLPYNYTLAYQASSHGTPFARPMDFYDTKNNSLQNINDQYFWGKELIVAPVLKQGQVQRNVVVPAGCWINYHTHQSYQGPGIFNMKAPLSDIPVLVKAGSFIPTVKDLQSTNDYSSEHLFIQYYPDPSTTDSYYTLFDDDKFNPNSIAENEFNLINFDGRFSGSRIEIILSNSGLSYPDMPLKRSLTFEIFRIMKTPESVFFDELNLIEYFSLNDLLNHETGYFHCSAEEKLYVKTAYTNALNKIRIENIQISNAIFNNETDSEIIVYPNPGHNELYISSLNAKSNFFDLKIFNSNGKLVLENKLDLNSSQKISTIGLHNGIYFIQVTSLEFNSVTKWVKY
jgi:oligosaccharide 4-alpha-D-glucosyltransferase